MCVRASMKAAKPLHIVLATNPNPTRARGYPLNINPKPDPKPDSISGPAGSGRVADLYNKHSHGVAQNDLDTIIAGGWDFFFLSNLIYSRFLFVTYTIMQNIIRSEM